MASTAAVKIYLAHWFQLGKKLVWQNGAAELLPEKIIQGDHYAPEFEACWSQIMSVGGRDCYVAGSNITIQELLSPGWAIEQCARCTMPIPMIEIGTQSLDCTCSDLDNWPNSELPQPHSPIDNQAQLDQIRQRLQAH